MTTVVPNPPRDRPHAKPSRGQARFAFAVLFIMNVLNYADRYLLPAVLPKIRGDLGLTPIQEGLLGSSFLLVYAFATLPLGIWADRSERKNIVGVCVAIWSIATTLAGITRNFAQLFIVRSVLGIGEGGSTPASLSLLGDYFPQAQRARILSYWSAGTVFGVAIGFAVGALVADAFGWRWAFYSVGIPGLIAAFLAWRMTEPERGAFDKEESEAQPVETAGGHGALGKDLWSSAKNLFKIPTYLALIGALVFSYFVFGGIAFWLPSYLVTSFNLHVSQAGAISGGVVVGGGLVGVVTGGWLADFLHRRRPEGRLFVATLGFLLGAPLFLLALFIHTLLPFLAVLILAAIALDFCIGPLNAVIQDVILPEVRATALGLALLLAHLLGDAAAPSIIGLIANTHTLGFALIITTPTSLFLAGLICLLGLRTVAQDMYRMQQQIRASEVAINKGKSEIS